MLFGDLTSTLQYLFVANGRITVALVAGAIAVYYLLPRPKPYPLAWGLVSGVIALVALGWYMIRPGLLAPEPLLFYTFSALAIIGAGLLLSQRNPARAALAFTLVILSSCGLFLLLAAPFVTAATIIIYAGAIVVTFLFVLMLAQQEGPSNADQRSREPLLATVAGFVLLGILLFLLQQNFDTRPLETVLERTRDAAAKESPADIANAAAQSPNIDSNLFKDFKRAIEQGGRSREIHALSNAVDNIQADDWQPALLAKDAERMRAALQKLEDIGTKTAGIYGQAQPYGNSPLSQLSGPASNLPRDQYRRENGVPQLPAENTAYLGRSLFTDYLLAVELGGTLLLVATVGAIAIAYRRPGRAT